MKSGASPVRPCIQCDGPPASVRRTLCPASARRAATTDPADPAPATTKSNSVPLGGGGWKCLAISHWKRQVAWMYSRRKKPLAIRDPIFKGLIMVKLYPSLLQI